MAKTAGPKKSLLLIQFLILLIVPAGFQYPYLPVPKAKKPPAPGAVESLAAYESRIKEPGLLIEDSNLQMWVPKRYEEHSRIIFPYLQGGYKTMSGIFGGEDMPVKFSIEHYPPGSSFVWGGTDAKGTIRYDYHNLEDDSPEWNLHGVPHMIGWYEEMAHCFVWDLGIKDTFYETLGHMTGLETGLRAAWNPYLRSFVGQAYEAYAASAAYFLGHDRCEPGIAENICLTRVLAHVFKTKVIDKHGWKSWTQAFSAIRKNYPLRTYSCEHAWGGFLKYLGVVIGQDLQSIFGSYGLPVARWTGEPGYEKDGAERLGKGTRYRFRVKITDREGRKPTHVALHLYGISLWHIGEFDDSGSEFDTNPRDDPKVVVFKIGQPGSQFPSGLGTDIGQQRSTIDIRFSGDLAASKTVLIRWTPGGSTAVDQFSIALDGVLAGRSKALPGLPRPNVFLTEVFRLPSAAGTNHVLRLHHLKGDGLTWDALQLGGCISGRFPMTLRTGNSRMGWIYQAEVETYGGQSEYAFSGNDGVHPPFQVVGQPAVKKLIKK